MEESERQILEGGPNGNQKQETRRQRSQQVEAQAADEFHCTFRWDEKRHGGRLWPRRARQSRRVWQPGGRKCSIGIGQDATVAQQDGSEPA